MRDNLQRLAVSRASDAAIWSEPQTDEQVASLAFLASELEADELVDPLYQFVLSWALIDGGR